MRMAAIACVGPRAVQLHRESSHKGMLAKPCWEDALTTAVVHGVGAGQHLANSAARVSRGDRISGRSHVLLVLCACSIAARIEMLGHGCETHVACTAERHHAARAVARLLEDTALGSLLHCDSIGRRAFTIAITIRCV